MNIALMIADVLIIVAFLGLIVALGALVFAALRLKNDAMRNAKRLYVKPMQSVKNLTTAGKGIVQQEGVRVRHAIDTIRSTSAIVKETVDEVSVAVETVRDVDWAPILAAAQTGMKFAAAAADVARAASKQGAER
jgi:hypothetical protein